MWLLLYQPDVFSYKISWVDIKATLEKTTVFLRNMILYFDAFECSDNGRTSLHLVLIANV